VIIGSETTGAAQAYSRKICNCKAQDNEGEAEDTNRATNSDVERYEIVEEASGDGYCVRMLYLRL
jgi:hypothetical protein